MQPQQPPIQEVMPPPVPRETPRLFNRVKRVLIIVFIVLLSSGVTYLVIQQLQQKQSPSQTIKVAPTPHLDSTAEWKKYTNVSFRFSLKYPFEIVEDDATQDYASLYFNFQDEDSGAPSKDISLLVTSKPEDENRYQPYYNISKSMIALRKGEQLNFDGSVFTRFDDINVNGFNAAVVEGHPAPENIEPIPYRKWIIFYRKNIISGEITGRDVYYIFQLGNDSEKGKLVGYFNQIVSTFNLLDEPKADSDESKVKELIYSFYQAFTKQDGKLLFSYMTPPTTPQDQQDYNWLTGADLGQNAFYRVFLRVRLSDPIIHSVYRDDVNTFTASVSDKFSSYSQTTAYWSEPTTHSVGVKVVRTETGWLIDRFTLWAQTAAGKYKGFPNLGSN